MQTDAADASKSKEKTTVDKQEPNQYKKTKRKIQEKHIGET